jgi:tetratricopeptide (TPR) repeat protein
MYSFKHALTQDVVYSGMLERRRRQYHAAAARGLEQLYAGRTDEVLELLAYHFGRSGEVEQAVDYAVLAAEKAQRRWANTEALAHFDDALKRLATMPDTDANRLRRVDAVVKQAEVMFALGRQAEHIQALEGIRAIVDGISDMRRRAAWYYWTGFLHSLTGARPQVAIDYCRQAAAIADDGGLDDIKAFTECCLAQVCAMAGELDDAVAAGERALVYFEARGNIWWACRTLWALSSAASVRGEWSRSLEYCHRALEHGQKVNDLRLKVAGWWRTGSTHVQRGDVEAGLRCCEEGLRLSPIPFDAANIKAVKGYGLLKTGHIEEGIALLSEALAWLDQSHLGYFRAFYALWLAEGCLRIGRRSRARDIVEEVHAATRGQASLRVEGIVERLLGETLVPDDPSGAAAHLDAATRIFEGIGARNELAKIEVARAELRRAAGDVDGARQLLERARACFEAIGTIDEPARVGEILAAL